MKKELTRSQMDALYTLDQARVEEQAAVDSRLIHATSARLLIEAGLITPCPDPNGGFAPHYRITDEGSLALARGHYESKANGKSAIQPYKAKTPAKQPVANDAQDDLVEAAEDMRKLASDLAIALLAERVPELKGIADTFAKADEAIEKARKGK